MNANHGRAVEKIGGKITIAHRIEAVLGDALEAERFGNRSSAVRSPAALSAEAWAIDPACHDDRVANRMKPTRCSAARYRTQPLKTFLLS